MKNHEIRPEACPYVPKSACWIWKGQSNRRYSVIVYGKKAHRGHRLFWQKFMGEIPEGLYVCHKCDNPLCVNPEHLFLGTQDDNMKDMVKKGRADSKKKRGKNNGRAILTENDVLAIRASKARHVELADKYNVTPTNIQRIRKGLIWGWL